jgi:hypothetical protein
VILCIFTSSDEHESRKILFGFASLFFGGSWLLCVLVAIFDTTTEETRIENELAAGLKKV